MRKIIYTLLGLTICSFASISQQRVTELTAKEGDESSNPDHYTEVNGRYVFQASSPETGTELWVTDATGTETKLLKDIYTGPERGLLFPGFGIAKKQNDKLYFIASDEINDNQIWVTDGTTEGTEMIAALHGFNAQQITPVGDLIFFARYEEDINTFDLMSLNINTKAYAIVKPGLTGYLSLANEIKFKNLFLFQIEQDEDNAPKLWRSDGTEAGSFPIIDNLNGIGVGSSTDFVSQFLEFQDELFFMRRINGQAVLMKTDGTTAGSTIHNTLIETNLARYGDALVYNNKMYFSLREEDTQILSVFEDDASGTPARLIFSGRSTVPSNLTAIGDKLFFTASKDNSNSMDLISVTLSDYMITPEGDLETSVNPRFFQVFLRSFNTVISDHELLINYLDQNFSHKSVVFNTQHSESRTVDIPFSTSLIATSFGILYTGNDDVLGSEPFKAGADLLNPGPLQNINDFKFGLDRFTGYSGLGDKVIFSGPDEESEIELLAYDESTSNTSVLTDLSLRTGFASVFTALFQNELYFTVNRTDGTYAFGKTDGTAEGTTILINAESVQSAPVWLTVINDELFATQGGNLAKFVDDNFITVKTLLNEGDSFSVTGRLFSSDNRLYFSVRRNELWTSDGTTDGTVKVEDIPGLNFLTPVGNRLFFFGKSQNVSSVYTTDGAPGNVNIIASGENIEPLHFFDFQGQFLFTMVTPETGRELWISDGTSANTRMVKDINPGVKSSIIVNHYQIFNDELYFGAVDGEHGRELWKTDGTEANTVLVKDINPGPIGSNIGRFESINGKMIFSAHTNESGTELWSSDGTSEGTSLAYDIRSGTDSSLPIMVATTTNHAYFLANEGIQGYQLWKAQDTPLFNIVTEMELNEDFSETVNILPEVAPDAVIIDYTISPESIDFANVSFNQNTGEISLTSISNRSGSQVFTLTATDNAGIDTSYQKTFSLTINPINDTPNFTITGDVVTDEDFDEVLEVNITPQDVPEDESDQVVTYTLNPTSIEFANINFNNQTGQLTFEALANRFGTQTFSVTANDGQEENNTSTASFTFTVNSVNDAPQITTISNQEMDAGTILTIDITTNDIEGDELEMSWSLSNEQVLTDENVLISKIDNQNFRITLSPEIEKAGNVTITLILDDQSITTNSSFELNVLETVITGIDAYSFDKNIKLYPNPTSNIVHLKFEENPEGTSLSINSSTAREILNLNLDQRLTQQINVSNLLPGIYILKLTDRNNRVAYKKFIKN